MGCHRCGHVRCEGNKEYICKECKKGSWLCGGNNHSHVNNPIDDFCCCGCADGVDSDNYICLPCFCKSI